MAVAEITVAIHRILTGFFDFLSNFSSAFFIFFHPFPSRLHPLDKLLFASVICIPDQ